MKKFKNEILENAVQLDASVNFQVNGSNLQIIPCPWEDGKEVTDGRRVRYQAGVEVDADGRTRVKRYNVGKNGPKQDTLYETAHGAVKITRPQVYARNGRRRMNAEFVYVVFKFPKKYGLALTRALYKEEVDEIDSYLRTRKEETIWK